MTIHRHNPWEEDTDISALVPLPSGDVSLFAHASGPSRRHGDPVVILFTGAGGPAAIYVKVQQHLSTFVRTLFYDRAGYDRSTLPSIGAPLTAEGTTQDLDALLEEIDVPPPYILLAHSFGGIPLREFLQYQLQKYKPAKVTDIIAGAVLYDTVTELAFALFPRLPSKDLVAVIKDVDWEELTNLKEESGMTDAEWEYAIDAAGRTREKVQGREDTHRSARELAEKRQLEEHVYDCGNLAVIRCNMARDYEVMYDEGVRLGGGTEEEEEGARRFIHDFKLYAYLFQRPQVELVGQRGSVYYEELVDWGHDSIMRKPEIVGEAIKWTLNELKKKENPIEGTMTPSN